MITTRQFCSSGIRWLWIAIIIFGLDRFTKHLAERYLNAYTELPIIPGFNLTLSYNKGAAFSFLDQAPGWQTWFFGGIAIVVTIGIIVWLSRLTTRDRWVSIALSLVVGGALGNLWDRINYGQVTDFIQLYVSHYYWPVFNVADSAVCVGAFMLFVSTFFKRKY
jgi:signal peptidase II